MRRLALALFVMVGCGGTKAATNDSTLSPSGGKADSIASFPACTGEPGDLNPGQLAGDGEAYFSGDPAVGQQVYVIDFADMAAYYFTATPQGATVSYTTDNWQTTQTKKLSVWCQADKEGAPHNIFGVSLGTFADPTTIKFAIEEDESGAHDGNYWLNNHGKNYEIDVRTPSALSYLGTTQVSVDGINFDLTKVPSGNDLTVTTQTYPRGAAKTVTLYWENGTAQMTLGADGVGTNGNNSQWTATIPAKDLAAGHEEDFYIEASDGTHTLYDSNNGANYKVKPIAYPVSWIGGFGSFQPEEFDIGEGGYSKRASDSDPSFTSGCDNHGADEYSFSAPAVSVFVTGLTDQNYDAESVAKLVRAEVFTNADKTNSWTGIPMSFGGKVGNNLVYMFFTYNDLCGGGGGPNVNDGSYEWKARFSTDGGTNWTYLGKADGSNATLLFSHAGDYSF